MQHTFALNLTADAAVNSATSGHLTLSRHCRTSIIDGFRIDKKTGELYGQFITLPYQTSVEQYQAGTPRLTSVPRQHTQPIITGKMDNVVFVDFRSTSDDSASSETVPRTNPRGAGRKPASTVNPIAYLAVELLIGHQMDVHMGKPLWLDNIIFGSCLTAAGQSKNVCNVSMNEVVGALYLPELKVEVLVAQGTPPRKAQRIIKAARHAAHGIHTYMMRRPRLLQSYGDSAQLEASLAPSHDFN